MYRTYKVLILMSTYNGGKKIKRQIESIISQSEVEASILIRDDGSDVQTQDILRSIEIKYPNQIKVIYGSNKGWKQSFLDLLCLAPRNYDFYGFSDQDDLWLDDKIMSCIKLMVEDNFLGVKLSHCNALTVDENLQPQKEQEHRIPCPPNFKVAIATEYFQGCGMIWNKDAMNLIQSYRPNNQNLAHDYWVGLVCYLMGKVYFCEETKFYHIRYGNNSSDDGNVLKGRIKRLKWFLTGKQTYMNPAKDLLEGYKNKLDAEIIEFLEVVDAYKSSINMKKQLFFDSGFRKPSIEATILLKMAVLFNRF